MEQFLEAETHIKNYLLDQESHIKFQFLVYHPETDNKVKFLDQETDIMGERNYILKPPYNKLKILEMCQTKLRTLSRHTYIL